MRCASCGFENPSPFNFCGHCGVRLGDEISISGSAAAEKPAELASPTTERDMPEAERRQLTVMFCDLAGSTDLSQRLDPEDFREVIRGYQKATAAVVEKLEGHVAQYLGDGILVYFGFPLAHEDDGQRAARAALEIVREIQQLNAGARREKNIRLAVRVGIHTGIVVVGEIGGGEKRELLALGETPNIAARLQNLAAPNTVVVSAATYRLIQGFFVCEHIGAPSFKGLDQPMELYRVKQESSAMSRLDVVARLTPFIGREQELAYLLDRWQQAKAGAGQIVLLSGEAGIGKSRLRQEFAERIRREPNAFMRCRCSPYYQNAAFHPIIEMLAQRLNLASEDSSEQKWNKLEKGLARYGMALPENLPLFARLFSLPANDCYALPDNDPELLKQQSQEALLGLLLAMADQQPVCFVIDDLNWIDVATLEMLGRLIPQISATRLLGLFSFRPAFQPPWENHPHVSHLNLPHLNQTETAAMIQKIAGSKNLPDKIIAQLTGKSDGVPLFVEEITQMVLESEYINQPHDDTPMDSLPPLVIPATLHDLLMARLDRLAAAKEVAQLGAAIGREFTYDLLQAISPLNEFALRQELSRLVEAGLLYQKGAKYIFKHALIRDAAYDSLLKSKRQQYHQQIAQVLSTPLRKFTESSPELVAYHQTAAERE